MQTHFIARHFINSEATLEEYGAGLLQLMRATEVASGKPLSFGMKLTVDKNVSRDILSLVRDMNNDAMAQMPGLWLLYDPEDRGPGTSYRQILFNPTWRPPSIVINSDMDQYRFSTPETQEIILDMAQRMQTENGLYATGSRDVPVVLATHKRNSDLRIIHELFHSLVIGSDKLRIDEVPENVTPAYARIGESTSGFYVYNTGHRRFPDLVAAVMRAAQTANLNGFANDYYAAMKSAELGSIVKGYVPSQENRFYEKKDERLEFEGVCRLISNQTAELGKTDMASRLKQTCSDEGRVGDIVQFYPREDVLLVRDLMLGVLR